jgi:hypothetical protein
VNQCAPTFQEGGQLPQKESAAKPRLATKAYLYATGRKPGKLPDTPYSFFNALALVFQAFSLEKLRNLRPLSQKLKFWENFFQQNLK